MIKNHWQKLFQNQLLAGSAVMFVGTMVANLGNYFYHLLMGRMLGPEGYGSLESIIAVIYLLFIFLIALSLVITKFVANLKGKEDLRGVSYLFHYFNRQLFIIGGLVALVLVAASHWIASFLHLGSVIPLVLIGLLFSISSLSSANRAILQGLLRFKETVVSHISETGLKVITAVTLVWIGLSVNGAVLALLVGGLAGYLLTLFFLKPIKELKPKKPGFNKKTFIKFGLPVFFFNLSFTSLYTSDIILVKHFFSPHEAGLYAALAVLGKIIFYATSPITQVMFPMAVSRHTQGKDSHRLLLASLFLVFLICLAAGAVYFFLPELMVSLLFGQDYLAIVPLLAWMAVFLSLYSFAFLLINFFLSIEKTKAVFWPVVMALGQIILIYFFHQSLIQVIKISIAVAGFLLLGLVLYYGYGQTKASFRHRSCL